MSNRFVLKTLGCKANLADSLEISRELKRRGWREAEAGESPSLCIVNSCTVTDEADRQSRKIASRLARENVEARVVVTGCAAEVDPERIARSAGIHYVIGNREKAKLVDLVLEKIREPLPQHAEVLGTTLGYSEIASRHPLDREWPAEWEGEASVSSGHTRGFLKIQEGCNSFCTYCIIPYGRGPSRSLRPLQVIERVRQACANGIREIVLTGTNLGDYGSDLSHELADDLAFEDLLRMILDETPLERLRLSSLDPTEITPAIFSLMERQPRLCAHFHVSLQSPVDRVLKLMKRKYTAAQSQECLERIAALPSAPFVGMDVIAGFPGETESDFEQGLSALESWPWSRLHVFPYSERQGTPATRLPASVPQVERQRRAKLLGKLSLERMARHYEAKAIALSDRRLGGVLLEKAQGEWTQGFSSDYLRVRVPTLPGLRNQVATVTLGKLHVDAAAGEVVYEATFRP